MRIFYPRCRTKHPQWECPLNNIFICHICTEEHPTDDFPLLAWLQAIYKSGDVGETSRRPPWKPRDPPPYQILSPHPPPYYQPYPPPQHRNTTSWQQWPPQYPPPPHFTQQQYWPQGWREQYYPQPPPVSAPNHPYPQHSASTQQCLPEFVPPSPLITQQPHHFQNTNPP